MTSFISRTAAAAVVAFTLSGAAQAAESVNVAFFLEWATQNQIAKVDKPYDEAMGVDVNWTDFSTGVAMTEAPPKIQAISTDPSASDTAPSGGA